MQYFSHKSCESNNFEDFVGTVSGFLVKVKLKCFRKQRY